MPDLETPGGEQRPVFEWLRQQMPYMLFARHNHHSVWEFPLKPLRAIARGLWLVVSWILDLAWRWLQHAVRLLYSSRGYVVFGLCAALYSFIYSLANEAYQRGELNASIRLSTFVNMVSGNSRPSFIAATKQIERVQNAPSFKAPSFWNPYTWFVEESPNRVFIEDWASTVFSECTAETCGSAKSRIDLREAVLGSVSLLGVDLHDADLSRAFFGAAELTLANFDSARLEHTRFWNPHLHGASFHGANLECAFLKFLDAHPAYSSSSDQANTVTSFVTASLRGAKIEGGNFKWADFSDADFAPGKCSDSESALFVDSSAQGAQFHRAKLTKAKLIRTNFEETNFQDADLSGADLRGAVFVGANLSGANLTGSIYSASTRWPAGYNPAAHGAILSPEAD